MTDPVARAASPDYDVAVSRELLAQMDEAATSGEHWKILLTSSMGFFTDAYDLFIIGVVASMVATEWHIASYQKSLLSSLALLTSAVGALVFGWVADKFGRRRIYGYEVLVLAIGAIATAFAPSIWWLIALRGLLGLGIGGDYPVSATIMSEYASRRNRGKMVALVFSAQGAGLVIGPLVAIGLLSTGLSHDYVWRIMLALGAIPGLAVFYLRRRIKETPRFLLAQMEAREIKQQAERANVPTGLRGVLRDRRLLVWLIGASAAWLLFDFVYYGNTISSPVIVKLVAPHASLIGQTAIVLAIFAVAALPAFVLAAFTIDRIGRKLLQWSGFAMMAVAFGCLWLVPGATATVLPFLLLFGATYFFSEFGPNTTTFVYPAEIFPVRVRTTCHGIAAASGKIGAFIGTYALTALLPVIGLSKVSSIVAGVSLLGLLVTLTMLPEPKGVSLEDLTEDRRPASAVALGLAETRGIGPPAARREYDHQPDAPAATWVAPCAFTAARDVTGRLLLVRRRDTGDWELPGGHVDPGESAADAAIRETAEESGITVDITGLAGIYTDPGHVIFDPRTGQVRQPFAVCFHARPLYGSPGGDQVETSEARWLTTGDIPSLPIQPAMRRRIDHALAGRACHIG